MGKQKEKVPLCENPFHMVNPFSSHLKFAEKYFPQISKTKSDRNDPVLTFEDSSTGLIWHFRFSLWCSSTTYVLTKGWPTFIKEKKLNNGDIVFFYRSVSKSTGTNRFFIHIKPRVDIYSMPQNYTVLMFTPSGLLIDERVREGLGFGSGYRFEPTWKPLSFGSGGLKSSMTLMPQPNMSPMSFGNSMGKSRKRLRLFGVNIDIPPSANGDDFRNEWSNGVA
ncbi:B3 domain-containing transcription factor NGA1-like [Panicum virgatum]|uniref:B3 domain-containing transcription factor NGA1-like n=1 Tax=Panicum virgatum TaxID=38727 RepID=UPI0019D5E152|nr:B3 domain-containing transcription factor NGA1-like [Panicum virgatum]